MCTAPRCRKQHLVVLSRSVSRWEVPLYAHSGTLMFLLDIASQGWLGTCHSALQFDQRTLELPPAIHIQRKQTMVLTSYFNAGSFPQLLESSCGSPTFSMQSFSLPCCA